MNKYRAVQGSLPRMWDIARWTEQHFKEFFEICTTLTQYDERGGAMIKVTVDSLKELEKSILEATPSYKTELLYRINQFTTEPGFTPRKFFYRLTALIRVVGNYVKKHPAILTDSLRDMIKDNPRLNWMIVSYSAYQTKMGASVTVPEARDTTTFQTKPAVRVVDPQTKMMNSMVLLADVFETLSKSLTKKELRTMKATDKISALSKLSFLFGNKIKPNAQVFQQVNIYKSDKDKLESALLDYGNG